MHLCEFQVNAYWKNWLCLLTMYTCIFYCALSCILIFITLYSFHSKDGKMMTKKPKILTQTDASLMQKDKKNKNSWRNKKTIFFSIIFMSNDKVFYVFFIVGNIFVFLWLRRPKMVKFKNWKKKLGHKLIKKRKKK